MWTTFQKVHTLKHLHLNESRVNWFVLDFHLIVEHCNACSDKHLQALVPFVNSDHCVESQIGSRIFQCQTMCWNNVVLIINVQHVSEFWKHFCFYFFFPRSRKTLFLTILISKKCKMVNPLLHSPPHIWKKGHFKFFCFTWCLFIVLVWYFCELCCKLICLRQNDICLWTLDCTIRPSSFFVIRCKMT